MTPVGKRVLVVEDAPEVRRVISQALQSSGMAVSEAGDGVEALDVLRDEAVDLVLTDCRMPRMSGPELMRAVGAVRPDLRFIVVSGEFFEATEGVKPFAVVPKPFRLGDLRTVVESALVS